MKLMKKNSLPSQIKPRSSTALKVDWNNITDRSASVHSEELSPMEAGEEGSLDELLQVKKKVKEVEGEHRRMVEVTLVLETLLESQAEHYYSSSVLYFLVHSLGALVKVNLAKLEEYVLEKKDFLVAN